MSPRSVRAVLRGLLNGHFGRTRGNFTEASRLDRLQPYFDGDGARHSSQALAAAFVLAASGDLAGARTRLGNFPSEVRSEIELQPDNAAILWAILGQMEALLGQKEAALRDTRKGTELLPEVLDAYSGPGLSRRVAIVYTWTGETEHAIAELTRLLRVPSAIESTHVLRYDATFTPLHGDPRFEALLNDPKNNQPLF